VPQFLLALEISPWFQDLGRAQGSTSLIAGIFLCADFYGTFNSSTLNQVETGFRLMQQVDAVL